MISVDRVLWYAFDQVPEPNLSFRLPLFPPHERSSPSYSEFSWWLLLFAPNNKWSLLIKLNVHQMLWCLLQVTVDLCCFIYLSWTKFYGLSPIHVLKSNRWPKLCCVPPEITDVPNFVLCQVYVRRPSIAPKICMYAYVFSTYVLSVAQTFSQSDRLTQRRLTEHSTNTVDWPSIPLKTFHQVLQ